MSRATIHLAAFTGLAFALAACATPAMIKTENFTATMDGKSEVPPKKTAGTGTVTASLDTATKTLTYDATFSGLSGPATAAHFHGPAAAGANAGVVLPWTANPTSPVHGTAILTDAQIADLEAGMWYANVHTKANPAGEIRGQVTKVP